MAHSLGYPHPDLMLDQMTSTQYRELLMFLHAKVESREQGEAEVQEFKVMQFFERKMALQKKAGNG